MKITTEHKLYNLKKKTQIHVLALYIACQQAVQWFRDSIYLLTYLLHGAESFLRS